MEKQKDLTPLLRIRQENLPEKEKDEKTAKFLMEAMQSIGKNSRQLKADYFLLSSIVELTNYLPNEMKLQILREAVEVSKNTLKTYRWKGSYKWVELAVNAAIKIPGPEGTKILEELGYEFVKEGWTTWAAKTVAEALIKRNEGEKAVKLKKEIEIYELALGNEKKRYQPLPPPVEDTRL